MDAFRAALGLLACLIAGPACIRPHYPSEWPARIDSATTPCPDLAGSYANVGTTDGDQPARLTDSTLFRPVERLAVIDVDLHPESPVPLTEEEALAVSHVTVEDRGADGVEAKAWVGDELLTEVQFDAEPSSCPPTRRVDRHAEGDVGLSLLPVPVWTNSAIGILPLPAAVYSYSWVEARPYRAKDGSIVIERRDSQIGLYSPLGIPIIPYGFKFRRWSRFLPAPPAQLDSGSKADGPRGVRSPTDHAVGLRPPADKQGAAVLWDMDACWEQAIGTDMPLDPRERSKLGGRSTQSLIVQAGPVGPIRLQQRSEGKRFYPGGHGMRIEKLHWLSPDVTDRYALCLLLNDYRWEG